MDYLSDFCNHKQPSCLYVSKSLLQLAVPITENRNAAEVMNNFLILSYAVTYFLIHLKRQLTINSLNSFNKIGISKFCSDCIKV